MATAKQTKEELLEDAERQEQLLEAANAKRREQLEQVRDIAADLKRRLQASYTDSKRLTLLQSVAIGLYEEGDKLSKKAPAETASDLMLEQVNDIIRETKELLQEDVYVQRLKEFVPAGNNPQLRDVVVVLRQLRQGMERASTDASGFQRRAKHLADEAQVVTTALELHLKIGKAPSDELCGILSSPPCWESQTALGSCTIVIINNITSILIGLTARTSLNTLRLSSKLHV